MNAIRLALLGATLLLVTNAWCAEPENLVTRLQTDVTMKASATGAAKALGTLAEAAGVKLELQPPRGENFDYPVTFDVKNVRAGDLLSVICAMAGLHYDISGESIRVRCKPTDVTMRIYDIADLITAPPNFSKNEECNAITCSNVADMIRNRIRPESWDAALNTSIEERAGRLVIMQTEDVHAAVDRLLDDFRQSNSSQIGIELRGVALKSSAWDRVLAEMRARGTSAPLLDDDGLTALARLIDSGEARTVFSMASSAYNAQHVELRDGQTMDYVGAASVNGDQLNPETRRLELGMSANLRPIVSDDGRSITLSDFSVRYNELAGALETALALKAGTAVLPGGDSTTKIEHADQEEKQDATEGVGHKGKRSKKNDVTGGYKITNEQHTVVPAPVGPLSIQLPGVLISRVGQAMQIPAGRFAGMSAPVAGRDGVVPGQEMLFLVRCTPRLPAPKPALPPFAAAWTSELNQRCAMTVSQDFTTTTLSQALQWLATKTRTPVVVDEKGLKAESLAAPGDKAFSNATAGQVLAWAEQKLNASIEPHGSLLLVAPWNKVERHRVVLRIYDLRDMAATIQTYPCDDVHHVPLADAVQSPFDVPATDNIRFGIQDIVILLKEKFFPAEFTDPTTSIEDQAGKLIVMQTEDMHVRIAQELQKLRANLTRRVGVSARWAVVDDAQLERALGGALAPVLNAGETAKVIALLASGETRDIASARTSAFNNACVSASGCMRRSIISDYEISGGLPEPKVKEFPSGAMLEVKPMLCGEKPDAEIRLDLRLNLTHLDEPVASFQSTAGDGAGAGPGITHRPVIHQQPIGTTVRVPNRGAALFRAPVPEWLGKAKRGQSLITLVSAEILQ